MTLYLVLTYHWFDEIVAGRKDVEYRGVCEHWKRRIWFQRDTIRHVCFSRGYSPRKITRPVLLIDQGACPYDGFNGPYYRIHFLPLMAITEKEP